jgi:hypothetical protein
VTITFLPRVAWLAALESLFQDAVIGLIAE